MKQVHPGALAALAAEASAAGFIEDCKASIGLRNFYYDLSTKNTANNNGEAQAWGQDFIFNYASGFTQGTVGFGVDAIGLLGVKLDSGGRAGKAGRERTPGQLLFPLDSDGGAVDDYSKAGVTAKLRLSKTEARIGTLQPKLPVMLFNDGRLLPQTFEGGLITSGEINGLTLTAGQLESTKTRSSTDDIGLRIAGASGGADNQTWSALFTYTLGGHSAGLGYQQVEGDSAFPFLAQGSGSSSYLITDRQNGKCASAGERTWVAEYAHHFAKLGAPGLKASVAYLKGDNVDSASGDLKQWARDLRLDYTLLDGPLKGLGVSWRNATQRGNVATDADENRLIPGYALTLL